MDSKTNHAPKKANDSAPLGVKAHDGNDATSRFSRRRFLRSAAVSSPILLSVKSPSAWGALYAEQCSISIYLSGNPSNPEPLNCAPKDIAYWTRTLSGGNPIVFNELYKRGYTDSTPFYNVFPVSTFLTWQLSASEIEGGYKNNWYFKLDSMSYNPTLLEALQGSGFNLLMNLEKRNSSGNVIDNANARPQTIDIVSIVPDFHAVMVAAFLNSLFHPTPVSYFYTDTVKSRFATAIEAAADEVIADLRVQGRDLDNPLGYAPAMQALTVDLSTWGM